MHLSHRPDLAPGAPPRHGIDGRSPAALRVLTVSSLYPNAVMRNFGVFVENRLRRIVATGEVTARVVAPVPWVPGWAAGLGSGGRWGRVPHTESRYGITVDHPRYAMLPKLSMTAQLAGYRRALRHHMARLLGEGQRFDLIDAHYWFPDGVAAVQLGRELGLPVIVTARGTDLNLYPQRHPHIGRLIAEAAHEAALAITVCDALQAPLRAMGIPQRKLRTLRNGVDLDLFAPPADREALRRELDLGRPTLLCVGHLIERKGVHLVIEALRALPEVGLLVVGDGPERRRLEAQAGTDRVAARVRFLGEVPHEALKRLYGAADALVLASSREGWANVLLEAMACGTPVVATDSWGTSEVVTAPAAGILVRERRAVVLEAAIRQLLADPPLRAATRRHAERFSWEETVRGQVAAFREVVHEIDAK